MPVKTEQLNTPTPLIDVQANSYHSGNKPDSIGKATSKPKRTFSFHSDLYT